MGVYAFNGAALELLQASRDLGRPAILDQTIAPLSAEFELLLTECERFPHWKSSLGDSSYPSSFIERERNEWAAASLIICGSSFVRTSLASASGPSGRCIVVPPGVDLAAIGPARIRRLGSELRVLTVGTLGLRKGTPYILRAANALSGRAVFRLIGDSTALHTSGERIPGNVEINGRVPRSEVKNHLEWAHVLLLPSLCEGAALSTYEALAVGVPVICTTNAGSMVVDGVNGRIIEASSVASIVESLGRLIDEPHSHEEMSQNACALREQLSLDAYAGRLIQAIREHLFDWEH